MAGKIVVDPGWWAMTCLTPLTICGAPTAGKSVVAALLDGTPAVSCTVPLIFHDNLSALLPLLQPCLDDVSSEVSKKFGEDKRLFFIRKLLIDHSAYYISLPPAFDTGRIQFFFSSSQVFSRTLSVKIPFFSLDSLILSRINALEYVSPANVFTIITKTILENIKSSGIPDAQYYLSIMANSFNNYEQILSSYANAKIIYIDRELRESIGSTLLRESIALNTPFKKVIQRLDNDATRAWIRQIHHSRHTVYALRQSKPNQVCVIDFQELMTATKTAMRRLTEFLAIPFDERCLRPSFMGIPMEIPGFFTIQDDMQRLLSPSDLSALTDFINQSLGKEPCKTCSPLRRIAARWRNWHARCN